MSEIGDENNLDILDVQQENNNPEDEHEYEENNQDHEEYEEEPHDPENELKNEKEPQQNEDNLNEANNNNDEGNEEDEDMIKIEKPPKTSFEKPIIKEYKKDFKQLIQTSIRNCIGDKVFDKDESQTMMANLTYEINQKIDGMNENLRKFYKFVCVGTVFEKEGSKIASSASCIWNSNVDLAVDETYKGKYLQCEVFLYAFKI